MCSGGCYQGQLVSHNLTEQTANQNAATINILRSQMTSETKLKMWTTELNFVDEIEFRVQEIEFRVHEIEFRTRN